MMLAAWRASFGHSVPQCRDRAGTVGIVEGDKCAFSPSVADYCSPSSGVRFPPPPLSKAVTFHVLSLRGGLPPTGCVPAWFQVRSGRRRPLGPRDGHGARRGRSRRRRQALAQPSHRCRRVRPRQVGVSAGALRVAVPEHRADGVQVDTGHREMRGAGVAEVVPAEVRDAGRISRPHEGAIERGIAHWVTPRPGEHGATASGAGRQARPGHRR
jgi:hypothetical protein